MLLSSNVKIARFLRKIEETCGSFALVQYNFHRLSPDTIRQGRALVKAALYHIRRGLKTGSIWNVSLDDRKIVEYFATAQNVDELFNLGGFEAFWTETDRGLRMDVMSKLAEHVTEKDLPKLKDFESKLKRIKYEEVEDFDFRSGRDITWGGHEWNKMDRNDFSKIVRKATPSVPKTHSL